METTKGALATSASSQIVPYVSSHKRSTGKTSLVAIFHSSDGHPSMKAVILSIFPTQHSLVASPICSDGSTITMIELS